MNDLPARRARSTSLCHEAAAVQVIPRETAPPAAFQNYAVTLTPGGGFRVTYRDQAAGPLLDFLRFSAWSSATGYASWTLMTDSRLAWLPAIAGCVVTGLVSALITRWKFLRMHSIEIRPDSMIVDGRWFAVEGFADEWPQLQYKNDNENRLLLCGVYGTRFVEFATANRIDTNDRTPERLASDLGLAMEQLWGRREAIVPTPF